MNLTNEILLFNRFLLMYDFVFCIIFILYFIVHMCEYHMY